MKAFFTSPDSFLSPVSSLLLPRCQEDCEDHDVYQRVCYSDNVFISNAFSFYELGVITASWPFSNIQDLPASFNTLLNASPARISFHYSASYYFAFRA